MDVPSSDNPFASPESIAPLGSGEVDPSDTVNVAVAQRRVLLAVGTMLLSAVGLIATVAIAIGELPHRESPSLYHSVIELAWLVLAPMWLLSGMALLIFVLLLSRSLRHGLLVSVFASLSMVFPWVNLVVLYLLIRSANGQLKRAGVRVGLLGVSGRDIRGLRERLAAN